MHGVRESRLERCYKCQEMYGAEDGTRGADTSKFLGQPLRVEMRLEKLKPIAVGRLKRMEGICEWILIYSTCS
jgi:hypothetical protein